MAHRLPAARLMAGVAVLVGAWGVGVPAAAQDSSARPPGPPAATPIADPPTMPAGDGTGARLHTALGDIVIGLFTESSPVAAENFANLVGAGFYDGTVFHRIVPGFVIQGGDPTGTGTGDPGYSITDEPVVGEYGRGIVAMARTPGVPNSQGSQFFIVLDDGARGALDSARTYAIIGRVVEGMEVADAIAVGPSTGPPDDRALEPVAIETATLEQVVLPPEPSPPPPTTDPYLVEMLSLTVAGQQLSPQTLVGDVLELEFGSDDPIVTGLREIATGLGHTMAELSIVSTGLALPDGGTLDITGLRVRDTVASGSVVPFASLITGDEGITATPATLGGRDVLAVTGAALPVPITAYVNGDTVLLIRSTDDAVRDEVLTQLP